MLSRSCCSLTILLMGLAVSAAEPTSLQWKFKEGDTFYIQNKVKLKQTMNVMGREIKQDMDQNSVTQFTVKKVNQDKSVVIEQTLLQMKGGGNLPGVGQIMDKVKGTKFTITLNDKNQIVKFEGYKAFIDKVTDGNDPAKNLVTSMLSEDTFKQSANEAFGMLPDKPVSEGDTWKRETKMSMGPIGDLLTSSTYKYAGKEQVDGKSLEKITYTATLKYSPPGAQPQGLPFRIVKGNMKAEEFKGEVYFDPSSGRVARSSLAMKVLGNMTFSAAGQMVDVEMKQDQTMTSSVLDKNPLVE